MTRPFPSGALVGLVLLLLGVGFLVSYCAERREVEQEAPPTPVVVILPTQPAPSPTPTAIVVPTRPERILATPLPTSTPTVAPSAMPTSVPTATRVPATPVQKGEYEEIQSH